MNIKQFCVTIVMVVLFQAINAQRPYQAASAMQTQSEKNKDFNFALFADINIEVNDNNNQEDLIRAVREVNLDPSIAFVFVAGNLTKNGDRESLLLAKKILNGLECNYYVVPGDGDTRMNASAATDFKKIFGYDHFRVQINGYLFIGLNTGQVFKNGDAHIVPDDIVWTQRQLKNIGKKKPVYIITNHPLKTKDVDNWYELTDVVRKYNTQAIINGNYCKNMIDNYDGIMGIINRSLLRGDSANAGYSLYSMVSDTLHVYEKIIGQSAKNWISVPVEKKMYVEGDEREFPRPNYKMNFEYNEIKREWLLRHDNAIYTAPITTPRGVVFADDKGKVLCVSYDKGKEIWEFAAMSRIVSSPAVDGDNIVFGSTDNMIYCLDVSTGSLKWTVYTDASVLGSPIIENGVVYIGSSDGKFRAINIENGDEIWSFEGLKNYQESRPLFLENMVMFGAWNNIFYCLNKDNGVLLWKWTNGENIYNSPARSWAVGSDKTVFFVTADSKITALDINNGSVRWQKEDYKFTESVGISQDNKSVYFKTKNDTIIAVDATKEIYSELWVKDISFGYDNNPSAMTEKNGKLLFGTKNGEIYCLNSQTGELLWKHKIGNELVNTIFAVSSNSWIVTTTAGNVVRLTENQ